MDNREIDRLIAEKVMGWIDGVWDGGVLSYLPGTGFVIPNRPPHYSKDLPHYSTDIAAAWQVWLWLENHYCKGEIALMNNGVFFWPIEEYLVQSDTYEKAICLAALKAIGVTP